MISAASAVLDRRGPALLMSLAFATLTFPASGQGRAAPRSPSVSATRRPADADGDEPEAGESDQDTSGAPPAPVEPSPSDSAETLLSLAEEAVTAIDYQRSRALAERAIEKGGLGVDELTRAYRVLALSAAQTDDADAAKRAFLRLYALEPASKVASRLAPARRSAALEARGFWSVREKGFAIDVSYARRERQVVVRLRDPIKWARTVHVWSRFGDRPYVKAERAAGPELTFDIDDVGRLESLEIYVFAVDEHGNALLELGSEREPHVFALSQQELTAVFRRDIRGGQTGSYARRLEELGVQVGVHGYMSLELKPVNGAASFDLHHATAMVRASLLDSVSLELALEWEHLGPEQGEFYIPHSFIDLKAADWLIVRAGFFEVPMGAFNEYLYPDFLRITGQPPLFSESVVPALWSEVGVQARGRFALGASTGLTYAAFVSNGLEQADELPDDGMIAEGGDIAEMRFNDRDEFNSDKGFGGRLGLEVGEFDFGASGYTGRYTIEGFRLLNLFDADFSFRGERLTVRAEGAIALQQTTFEVLRKYGAYGLLAWRVIPYFEPYAEYDIVDLGGREQRALGGLALFPFPRDRETNSLRLKSEAGMDFAGGDRTFVWFFQLTTGF